MEVAEGRACAFVGTCGECRNYRTCSGAAAGGPCSSEESTTQSAEAVEGSDAAGGTATRIEVPQSTATYNAVGHSYGSQTIAAEEAASAPEELDQQEVNGNAATSEPIVDIVVVGPPGEAGRSADERLDQGGQRYVAILQQYNRNHNRELNEPWRPNEIAPDELVEPNGLEASAVIVPPQIEPTTAVPLASLMQGDEGGDGSTTSTRDQMAAESELLACQREAGAGYEEIDRRNNEQEAERQEIIRQENDGAAELRDAAREQRRRASIVEASTGESTSS